MLLSALMQPLLVYALSVARYFSILSSSFKPALPLISTRIERAYSQGCVLQRSI